MSTGFTPTAPNNLGPTQRRGPASNVGQALVRHFVILSEGEDTDNLGIYLGNSMVDDKSTLRWSKDGLDGKPALAPTYSNPSKKLEDVTSQAGFPQYRLVEVWPDSPNEMASKEAISKAALPTW